MRYAEENRKFFLQSAEILAPMLLGKLLCREFPDGTVKKFRITETEAYCEQDSASHSFGGITNSNRSMFMTGGTAYVFNCHGWQFNIVCNNANIGEGVLIRAVDGYDGPVKLTKGLDIIKEGVDGTDLLSPQSQIWLEDDGYKTHYKKSVRKLGENRSADADAQNRKWRFQLIYATKEDYVWQ